MLLTGFDAPIVQTMYLDSPLRDHNLLQAIARTNRPGMTGHRHEQAVWPVRGLRRRVQELLGSVGLRAGGFAGVQEHRTRSPPFSRADRKAMKPFDGIALEDSYECSIEIVRRLHEIDQTQFEKDFRDVGAEL